MSQYSPLVPGSTDRKPPLEPNAPAAGVAVVAMLFGALVTISHPVATAALATALLVAAVTVRAGGPALGRRLRGRATELDVPCVGTVQIRVHGR